MEAFNQLQTVCVGRLNLSKKIVVVDDLVATVLRHNRLESHFALQGRPIHSQPDYHVISASSVLLSTLLLNGPTRIVSLSDVGRVCEEDGLAPAEKDCCIIAANDQHEAVIHAKELLEEASVKVEIFSTE
jgi:hypothetical protein